MEFAAERKALIRAGKELLEKGLVARTWGNLSIRLDDNRFLITPSGRNYETVAPEDLALVSLEDLTWEGPLKPSSEKELHARSYRCRPDVGAVVHTHQSAASSLAAARKGFIVSAGGGLESGGVGGEEVKDNHNISADKIGSGGSESGFDTAVEDVEKRNDDDKTVSDSIFSPGSSVPCVPYALPTTKALAKAVEKTLRETDQKVRALLLSNHGTVCFGIDIEEALLTALALENAAEREILEGFRKRIGAPKGENGVLVDEKMIRARTLETYTGIPTQKALLDEAAIEGLLITLRKELPGRIILRTRTPYVVAASWYGQTVKPYLDDFAQLIGPSLPVVTIGNGNDVGSILRILKRRSAVLIQGLGCICIGENDSDSRAVGLVAEKGCRAAVETAILGSGCRIGPMESRLMRLLYLMKYSKKAA